MLRTLARIFQPFRQWPEPKRAERIAVRPHTRRRPRPDPKVIRTHAALFAAVYPINGGR
jgi:hypothetical protein